VPVKQSIFMGSSSHQSLSGCGSTSRLLVFIWFFAHIWSYIAHVWHLVYEVHMQLSLAIPLSVSVASRGTCWEGNRYTISSLAMYPRYHGCHVMYVARDELYYSLLCYTSAAETAMQWRAGNPTAPMIPAWEGPTRYIMELISCNNNSRTVIITFWYSIDADALKDGLISY